MSLRFPIWAVLLLLIIAVGATYYYTEQKIRQEYEEIVRSYGEQMEGYIESESEKMRAGKTLYVKCPGVGMDALYPEGDVIFSVTAVDVGGLAEKAGVDINDLIVAVNGEYPTPEIMEALAEGDILTVKIVGDDGAETGETFEAVMGGKSARPQQTDDTQ